MSGVQNSGRIVAIHTNGGCSSIGDDTGANRGVAISDIIGVSTQISSIVNNYFGTVFNAGIPGYNQEIVSDLELDECQSACAESDWCKSVDYDRVNQTCYLQSVAEEDVGSLRYDYPGNPYDHYYYKPRLNYRYPQLK